ncbi:MAG: NADP-binding protein [Clostridia bacterium]|nr:NADP-binding protein [Clostridia bacterium]MBR5714585.1 NADP-binding protein [Clostridia bacterium]
MENVRVAIWGFGAMGSGIAKMLLGKKGVEITGVCDMWDKLNGMSIFERLGIEKGDRKDVFISNDINKVIYKGAADVAIVATDSFVPAVFPKIKFVLEQGINVVTTAEEMSYPKAQHPELAAELDRIAKENGVTVLGTGINPGLMMDLLAICLSGCMIDVESVMCKRVNSLSPFGPAVMKEQGIGITVDEFNKGVEDGSLAGHVGFEESAGMIAEALGWKIEKFEKQMAPIVTTIDRQAPYGFAAAGNVAGVNMTAQAYVDGKMRIDLVHPQQIEPEMEGTHTGDYVVIEGTPSIHVANTPEVDGGLGTIAMCVNMIPHVINAKAGLKTMIDLPVPHAIMGDFRDYIEK